jgi:hypothetical protein
MTPEQEARADIDRLLTVDGWHVCNYKAADTSGSERGPMRVQDTLQYDRYAGLKPDLILVSLPFKDPNLTGERVRDDRRLLFDAPAADAASPAGVRYISRASHRSNRIQRTA